MRPSTSLAALACSLFTAAPAVAGSHGGGGGSHGGGGALSHVSSGIGRASGGGSHGGGGGGRTPSPPRTDYDDDDGRDVPIVVAAGGVALVDGERSRPDPDADPPGYHGATVHLSIGAQMVHDSDGAFALDLDVTDRRFRLAGSITQYYERQPSGDLLTMTMPTLTGGLRIDDMGNTHVFVEGGVVLAKTRNDPVMDSSITGAIGGIHVEHWATPSVRVFGDAQVMAFPDEIRARAFRAGVRLGHFQAGFRVLDFNVGPALYGPELGLTF